MKAIFISLLIFQISFAQKPTSATESFSIKNNTIFWENTFESDSTKAITYFKENLKIPDSKKGTVINQKNHCPGVSGYLRSNFQFSYKIKYGPKNYTVIISEIIFDDEVQIHFNNVSTSGNKDRIEDFEIKSKDGNLRKNQQSIKNFNCLNNYFNSIFTIN